MVQVNPSSSGTSVVVRSSNSSTPVVVGQGTAYYVDIARQWAISTNLVQNTDYSSKYYAGKSQEYANSILADAGFIAVSESLTAINNVADDLIKINGVYNDLTNINIVANDKANIDTNATYISNINTVAGSISNVNTVATNISDVNTVATDISSVITSAVNVADIATCSVNINNINACAANIPYLANKANTSLNNLDLNGKAKIAVKQYLTTETYTLGDVVLARDSNNITKMYRSIANDNINRPLTNTAYWTELVNLDELNPTLASKANKSLNNCTDDANILMAHNAMMSDEFYSYTPGANGAEYIAPADGFATAEWYSAVSGYSDIYLIIKRDNDTQHPDLWVSHMWRNTEGRCYAWLPVRKNQKFTVSWYAGNVGSLVGITFLYAVGSESEAS